MVNAADYRAMAAEHHRLAGMCRAPRFSANGIFGLKRTSGSCVDSEERLHGAPAPGRSIRRSSNRRWSRHG